LDGHAIQNDVFLSNIIVSIPHVPNLPTLSFTVTDLFNMFSVSCQVLQNARAGLHELCFFAVSYCFWSLCSRLWEFSKSEARLEIQQDPVDQFTTVGTKPVSGSTHKLDEFMSLMFLYHSSLQVYQNAPEVSCSPHQLPLTWHKFLSWEKH
jgi:hypothetical protein